MVTQTEALCPSFSRRRFGTRTNPRTNRVLLGVVSATAGLGAAGWIAGLVTGSAAAAVSGTSGR